MKNKVKFFVGATKEPVAASLNDRRPECHYAWCIEKAIIDMQMLDKTDDIRMVMLEFLRNMSANPTTKTMMEEAKPEMLFILNKTILPNKEYLKQFLLGMPLPEKGYLSISTANTQD